VFSIRSGGAMPKNQQKSTNIMLPLIKLTIKIVASAISFLLVSTGLAILSLILWDNSFIGFINNDIYNNIWKNR
jgi:hypothetical protein